MPPPAPKTVPKPEPVAIAAPPEPAPKPAPKPAAEEANPLAAPLGALFRLSEPAREMPAPVPRFRAATRGRIARAYAGCAGRPNCARRTAACGEAGASPRAGSRRGNHPICRTCRAAQPAQLARLDAETQLAALGAPSRTNVAHAFELLQRARATQPSPLAEAQALLAGEEGLLAYAIGETGSALAVVRSDRAEWHELDTDRTRLTAAVQQFRRQLDPEADTNAPGQQPVAAWHGGAPALPHARRAGCRRARWRNASHRGQRRRATGVALRRTAQRVAAYGGERETREARATLRHHAAAR